jgi:hypothetical protein
VTWHHGGAGYGAAGWSFEVTATRRSKLSPAPIRPIMFQSLARELSGGKRRVCVHLLQRRLDVQIRFVRRVRQSSGPHADIINLHMNAEPSAASKSPLLFLSHSGEDVHAARELAGQLRAAGLDVWLDIERPP